MKKLSAWRLKVCSMSLRQRLILLCKIFVIGLLLQFFLQTFVTFKLGRDGKFWTIFWMWKEFILLIFVITLLWYFCTHIRTWIKEIKNKEHCENVTRKEIFKNIKGKFIFEYFGIFLVTTILFIILALLIQHVGLKATFLSFKYDLLLFFIFGVGICLALLFFSEDDKELLELYNKLIIRSLRLGIFWRIAGMLDMLPSILKYVGFDPNSFEGTVGANPPAAYYTKIKPFYEGSYVRNTYLFERPTSFGFRLIAFFPVFVLGYLKKKTRKEQILPVIVFGLLILSTWSRAGIAVWALEAITLFFILYRKQVKKYFVPLLIVFVIGLGGAAYLGRGIMIREHSNTGHLVLMKAGWDIAKQNPIVGRGGGYAGPASHQLCYIDSDLNEEIANPRCQIIKATNDEHQISTHGFNPENQYLQILIEYGIAGTIFWLCLCCIILRYTVKSLLKYKKKNKSPYQELLYYTLLGFGIGFIGLCLEGLVLHSLADRMVVYPFFLLYGITVGLREKEKDKQYIPPIKKKKSKKNNKEKNKGKK